MSHAGERSFSQRSGAGLKVWTACAFPFSLVRQMPPGIPVGTLAVGEYGATNAGILAAQILAGSDPQLAKRLHAYKAEMVTKVQEKNAQMIASLKQRKAK